MENDQGPIDDVDSSDFTMSSVTEPDLSEVITSHDFSARKITKHLVNRKQMSHDMQIMKLELNQKSLTLETLKADYEAKQEDMQDKINELHHQKALLQNKLDMESQRNLSETRRRLDNTKREFEAALMKQMQLEEANNRLIHKTAEIKQQLNFDSLHLSEEQYEEFRSRQDRDISIHDFVAMRFFEVIRPIQRELIEFRSRLIEIEKEKQLIAEERADLAEGYSRERELHLTLQEEYQNVLVELADTKAVIQHGNYKIENYDQVRDVKDRLETDLSDLQERHINLEVTNENLLKERDELLRDKTSAKQTVSLLMQDKEYLSKQNNDLTLKNNHADERIQQLTRQLNESKEARESLYEKYIQSRDDYKAKYENSLNDELEKLRLRTNSELERLKLDSKEMYERENHGLKEQRDEALLQRDRADCQLKEISSKYDDLKRDLSNMQSCTDTRVAELLGDARLKAFELERSNMMVEELRMKIKELELGKDKLQLKLETVTKEYFGLETEYSRKLVELETRTDEQKTKLDSYQAVESELDQVVLEAAEKFEEHDINIERVTFAFADGANLPSTARRRMQQSVHLARRVLALERTIRELNQELEVTRNEREKAQEEAERTLTMMNDIQQPYGYLVDSLRLRDEQLTKQRDQLGTLEAECKSLRRERAELHQVKNQMSADLEKLLSQREELAMLKRLMHDLKQQRNSKITNRSMNSRPKNDELAMSSPMDESATPEVIPKQTSVDELGAKWTHVLKQRNIEPNNSNIRVYRTYFS